METGYISREAAIKVHCLSCFAYAVCNEEMRNQCPDIKALIEIPAADVVEVVRCCDCENWDKSWLPHGDKSGNSHFCPMIDLTTDGAFFCSKGERRADNG